MYSSNTVDRYRVTFDGCERTRECKGFKHRGCRRHIDLLNAALRVLTAAPDRSTGCPHEAAGRERRYA